MFSGAETNSIHLYAASGCLLPAKTTKSSEATVVAHCLSCGNGAAAHLPVASGKSDSKVPANQAPAIYMATSPFAKVTRPSHEFEFKRSGGEYFFKLT